jgi:hypothetical protein
MGMRSIRHLQIPAALVLVTASASAQSGDLLLIPDSGPTLGRVWALNASDGSLVSNSFIPGDARLTQPIQIVDSGSRTLLVTDEVARSVFEYSPNGTYLRTLASGLDGAFGICMHGGFAYVTSGFSNNLGGKIYRIALDGSAPVVFSDWAGIGDPRGIIPYAGGFLVGNSTDDDLELVGAGGTVNPMPFFNSDGISSINFPQQLVDLGAGNVMAVGFSAPWGLFLFDSTAINYASYRAPEVFLSPRGGAILDNGQFLYTGGTRIDRFSTKDYVNVNIVNQVGASFRWVTRYTPPAPCLGDINGDGAADASDLAVVLGAWGTADAAADLDDDGAVGGSDLAIVLGAWGPCS